MGCKNILTSIIFSFKVFKIESGTELDKDFQFSTNNETVAIHFLRAAKRANQIPGLFPGILPDRLLYCYHNQPDEKIIENPEKIQIWLNDLHSLSDMP